MTPSGSPADPLALSEDEMRLVRQYAARESMSIEGHLWGRPLIVRLLAMLDATHPSGDEALDRLRAMTWDNPDVAEGVRFAVEYLSARPNGDEALDEVLTDTLTPWHGTVADDDDGMLRRCIDIQCMGTSEVVQRDFTGSITVRHKPGCAVVECFRRAALATPSSAPDVEGLPPNAERILLDYWWEHGTEALEETNASGLAAVVIRDLRVALRDSCS